MDLMYEQEPKELTCPECGSEDVEECLWCGVVQCYNCGRIKTTWQEFADLTGVEI